MFKFGDVVKDKISKVEGVITGHASYVTGCDQFLVQPIDKKNKLAKPENFWIDENRLEKIGEDKDTKSITKEEKGADLSAPVK